MATPDFPVVTPATLHSNFEGDKANIPSVAQTNIALYRQLHALGYSADALNLVQRAYAVACILFTSRFRASEKPFVCHLVGTASITARLGATPRLVAAALLHAAYESGGFGFGAGGPTRRNRAWVRRAVGDAVEELVFLYWNAPWHPKRIEQLAECIDAICQQEKDVLVLRLANELEDYLDLAMCYCAQSRRQSDATVDTLCAMADSLGLHGLGASLRTISNEMQTASWTRPLATNRRSSHRIDAKGTIDVSGAISRLWRQLARLS